MASCPFDSKINCMFSDGRFCHNYSNPCFLEYIEASNKQRNK